ncbi:MAG: VOC family protein, partial [Kiloniellales bacterium]|nr:VOC family protein [Kiloniellales bacterium]
MPKMRKLGHVVLFVRDPVASGEWYRDILGMDVVVQGGQFPAVFLSVKDRDHDLALFESPQGRKLGYQDLEHISFEIEGGLDEWKRFNQLLAEKGVEVVACVDHGISYGVYFLDPDGHHVEVFCQRHADDALSKKEFARIGAIAVPVNPAEA